MSGYAILVFLSVLNFYTSQICNYFKIAVLLKFFPVGNRGDNTGNNEM